MSNLYPKSHVEIDGMLARYYEHLLNLVTAGQYGRFIEEAIEDMDIKPEDRILDFGSGSGYNAEFMINYLGDKGEILGLDISRAGIARFNQKFSDEPGVNVKERRIDRPLPYESEFNKVLSSFVIHGLPHSARKNVLKNARKALVEGGRFYLLDYGEFALTELPLYLRIPFKVAECEYAFDYIARNWEGVLHENGLEPIENRMYLDGFTRLLVAEKSG
jgi:demethylmenaquinone methyltransferase/2-methoxy-6-polyprenyl-1,4-benzoquinol methylase